MIREARLLAVLLAIGSAVVLAAAMAPWVIDGGPADRFVRAPFQLLCHGIASRSLTHDGEPMSLCARCSGIFGGLVAGSLLSLSFTRRLRVPGVLAWLLLLPMLLDGITQAVGIRESWNTLRVATGFVAGAAAICWALASIARNREQATLALP